MSAPLLSLHDVALHYGGKQDTVVALRNLDLNIQEREFVCILGPSGCGKSSLLGLLAGFHAPSHGRIALDGREIAGPDWQRGVVFQNPALYPWLDVYHNVEFGPRMRGVATQERRDIVQASLASVHMEQNVRQYPYELSGGMKQRVAIARAIANRPRILLMDEPFGALDAFTREQMQVLIRNIWNTTHTTILLVTHDIDEALLLGTRIVVLSRQPGTIVQEFSTAYTLQVQSESHDCIRHRADYLETRQRIARLIHGNTQDYSI